MTSPLAATLDVHIANIKSLTSMPRSSAIVITSVVSSILEPLVLSSVSTDLKLKSKGFQKPGWTIVKIRQEDIRFEFSRPTGKNKETSQVYLTISTGFSVRRMVLVGQENKFSQFFAGSTK